MSIQEIFKIIMNNHVEKQVRNINLPSFNNGDIVRKKINFTGRVQKVGFRFEVLLIAKKLELTGWIKNNTKGGVEAEIQGDKDKIDFLIQFMKSLKRINIVEVKEQIIDVIHIENEFIIIK